MAKQRSFDLVTVVGVAVALALLFGGQVWMKQRQMANQPPLPPPPATAPQAPNTTAGPVTPNTAAPAPTPGTGEVKPGEPKGDTAPPAVAVEDPEPVDTGDIIVSNDSLKLVFSAKGATLWSAALTTEYVDPAKKKDSNGQELLGLELLGEIEKGKRTFGIPVFDIGPVDSSREGERAKFFGLSGPHRALDERMWSVKSDTGSFVADSPDGTEHRKIVYSTLLDKKYAITKTFIIPKTGSNVLMDVGVESESAQPVSFSYNLNGPMGVLLDGPKNDPKGGSYVAIMGELGGRDAVEDHPEVKPVDASTAEKGVEEKVSISRADNTWAAVKNRFYMSMLVSLQPRQVIRFSAVPVKYLGMDTEDKRLAEPNLGVTAQRFISPTLDAQNKSAVDHYALYLGPNDEGKLQKAEDDLKLAKPVYMRDVVQYCDLFSPSWRWPNVDRVARLMMWVFQGLYHLFGSFGLAVILLTLFIKVVMHPVQRKMMVSMDKLAKLKPELDKIAAKYKDQTSKEAVQKMRMEQMDMQMKAGANPMAGCLPMLITIPMFSALYGIFNHAFEIRGAQFLWVADLSQQDHLCNLPFWPHVLNLLPILYMVLTFLQTKLNPSPPTNDPQQEQQRKMMMFMPLLFSFIFYRMPAGLVLYFAANAFFGMIETWYIKKHIIKNPGAAPAAAASGGDGVLRAAR